MISCCLVQASFSGIGKEIVLELFNKISGQDYKKPQKLVGFFIKDEEKEYEFSNVKTYWGNYMVRYFTDLNPNLDTLQLIGKKYSVDIEIQYEFIDSMRFGTAFYDCEKDKLTLLDFTDSDFFGYDFKDGYYYMDGQRFPSKYFLRHYFFERAQRDKKLEFILNSFE